MTKVVIIFSAVLGTILSANAIFMMELMVSNPNFEGNDVLGYAAMVVVFSLIYVGVRNYRNKYLGGIISFGKAFKTGAMIAFVASTLYVVIGLSYLYLFVPDFLDHYINYVLRHTPQQDLASKTIEMADYKEMYQNPFFAILITYTEVLPIGLVVAVVSALILKKKRKKTEAYATS